MIDCLLGDSFTLDGEFPSLQHRDRTRARVGAARDKQRRFTSHVDGGVALLCFASPCFALLLATARDYMLAFSFFLFFLPVLPLLFLHRLVSVPELARMKRLLVATKVSQDKPTRLRVLRAAKDRSLVG